MAIIWCMLPGIWSATDINFCHFVPFFAFLPHYWPWKLKFGKYVKKPGDVIVLHMHTISEDHMYVSWDIRHSRAFLSFWAIFCVLTLLTTRKIKILKIWKKYLQISFYTCLPQMTIIWCMVPEIWSVTYKIFYLRIFFPFTPLATQKIKI